eukprot:s917_g29.t1
MPNGPALFQRSVEMQSEDTLFVGPCWMDDLCVAISDHQCADLITKATTTTGLLLDHCLAHAMTPNLAAGKTEVLFALRGRGARQHKVALYGPVSSRTLPIVGEYHSHAVHVVTQYNHLGCTLHHSGDLRAEIRRRIGIAHSSFRDNRKVIFRNGNLPFAKKTELFQCLILSKFQYGTESWVIDDIATKEYLHAALIRLYRRLLGRPGDQHLTDEQVLFETGLPSPTELLRLQRLRYLGTLYRCYDLVDWGVLNADQSWLRLIEDDLRWLWFQLQGATHLPNPTEVPDAWLAIARDHGGYWKRLVRRGGQHARRQRERVHRVTVFHQDFLHFARSQAFLMPDPDDTRETENVTPLFGCMSCAIGFKSRGGEGAHMFKIHGIVNPVRLLFQSTQCLGCMKEYHTAAKLTAHLVRSEICRRHLLGTGTRFTPMPGCGSRADGQLALQHDRLLPPLRLHGPLPEGHARRDFDMVHWELLAALCDAILDLQSVEDLMPIVQQQVNLHPIGWTRFVPTIDALCEILVENATDEAVMRLGLAALLQHCRDLQRSNTWPFLCCTSSASSSTNELAFLEYQCGECKAPANWNPPRAFGRHRIILHAFSGRRRIGDFQFYLDLITQEHTQGYVIHTVSLDIVVNDKQGNIADPAVRAFWLNGISRGWIIAFLAGPPCETWSRARSVAIDDAPARAPRPVRSAEELWGLAHLRLRELDQIDIGNLLLCFAAESFFRVACCGGIAVIEHPKEPDEEELPSIWRLPLFACLRALPGVALRTLSQGLLGAPSMKPTSLLTLNLPGLPRAIVQHRLVADNPKGGSIGRTAEGHWKTGYLKEYPPAMNKALAEQFWTSINELPVDPAIAIDEDFLQVCREMTITAHTSHIGQDSAG